MTPAVPSALDAATDVGGADAVGAIRTVTMAPPRSLGVLLFTDDRGRRLAALVDSLASCALEPVPMVSLLLPAGHGGYAWAKTAVNEGATVALLTAADARLATATAAPGGLVDEGYDPPLWARLAKLPALRLTVVSATQLPPAVGALPPAPAVLLTATVDAVAALPAPEPLLLRVGTLLTSLAPSAVAAAEAGKAGGGAAAAAAAASSLTTTAATMRSVLRHAASAVALVTVTAVGGAAHALTATSVRVPAGSPALLVFNVARDSLFGAALGDAGTRVAVAPLRPRHAPLAARFATSAAVAPRDAPHFVLPAEQVAAADAAAAAAGGSDAPAAGSVEADVARDALPPLLRDAAAVVGTVVVVMPAGDHVVVVAQATRAVASPAADEAEGHLVWLARQYQSVAAPPVE